MTYFSDESLVEAKTQLARAALRVWPRLPENVAGDVLRIAEADAAKQGQSGEPVSDKLHRALTDHDPDQPDLLALADALLGAWHRITGMAAAGMISRAWQDIAHLEDQDETDALLRFDFLVEEHGKGQAEAMGEMQARHADKTSERERRRAEVDRARTKKRLKDEKAKFSLRASPS